MFHDKKISKNVNIQPGHKSKKRQFHGNRYSSESEIDYASTSAKKLKASGDSDVQVDVLQSYCIISFLSSFSKLTEILECKTCKKEVRFSKSGEMGLGFKLVIECSYKTETVHSCPLINNQSFDINRRIVFVMRILGIGLSGLNIFCGLMDLCNGFTTRMYCAAMDNIYTAAQAVHDLSIKNAAKEIEENTKAGNEPLHLTVSGDGTWSKRGFSSLFGVITLIGKYTNKVLDVMIKSSFCKARSLRNHDDPQELLWQEENQENCTINYSGSAGKMEVDGIIEMFLRSKDLHGVMYKSYIGGGDSKTFKWLLNEKPYGDELLVNKKECIAHVQKRMGSRLRNAKKSHKGIGGKGTGKLTVN